MGGYVVTIYTNDLNRFPIKRLKKNVPKESWS